MQRSDALRALGQITVPEDLFVSSIGDIWDDWWNFRPGRVANTFSPNILGSVTPTALGLAIALPHRRVVALDTDGSMLLNTGALCTLGNERPENLTVLVLDNGIYESIGAPPTHTAGNVDLAKMAQGAGCLHCETVDDVASFSAAATRLLEDGEAGLLVAKIEPGSYGWDASDRKPTDGVEDKYRFIRYVEQLEGIAIHRGKVDN